MYRYNNEFIILYSNQTNDFDEDVLNIHLNDMSSYYNPLIFMITIHQFYDVKSEEILVFEGVLGIIIHATNYVNDQKHVH